MLSAHHSMFISFDLGVSSNDKVPYEATEEQEA